jgi:hypothetical protein
MDDVIRTVTRARSEKLGGTFLTYFSISALDGQLASYPDGQGHANLLRRLLLGHDAVIMDLKTLGAYDESTLMNGPRVVLYDPNLEFDGKLREGSIILHLGAPRCDFEGCLLKDIAGPDGGPSVQRVLEVVRRTGIRSLLLDGRSGISDLVLYGSGADIVVNCVVPIMSGGRGQKERTGKLAFREVRSVPLGKEIIYFGVPEGP